MTNEHKSSHSFFVGCLSNPNSSLLLHGALQHEYIIIRYRNTGKGLHIKKGSKLRGDAC